MNMFKNIILEEQWCEAGDGAHWLWIVWFWVKNDIIEHRIILVGTFDVIYFENIVDERTLQMVWIGLNLNVNMKMEYGVGTVWLIEMSDEHARSVIGERLYGHKANACDAFFGVLEMGFIFLHHFQEDFDVDGVSNTFLPWGSVQGYGRFEFAWFKVYID